MGGDLGEEEPVFSQEPLRLRETGRVPPTGATPPPERPADAGGQRGQVAEGWLPQNNLYFSERAGE